MKKVLLGLALLVLSAEVFSQCSVTVAPNPVTCFGLSNGSALATPAGGTAPYAYAWSTSPVQTTKVANGLKAGTYTVTIQDSKGCTSTNSVTITQPIALRIASSHQNNVCNGGSFGTASASVTGGSPAYTYSWSSSPVQNTSTAFGLAAGIYSVMVTDKNGCILSTTDTIQQPVPLVIQTSSTPASCSSATGSASVSISSGGTPPFAYSWSNGATGATDANVVAGNYEVTVTDANTCTATQWKSVANSAGVTAGIVGTNLTCYAAKNGSAVATPGGGQSPYAFLWSNAATGQTAGNLSAGIYSVTVTDANGCAISSSALITRPDSLSPSLITANISCFGGSNGSITAVVSGGTPSYNYAWSSGLTGTTSAVSGLMPGTYTLTVTDANSCASIRSTVVGQPINLIANLTETDVTCNPGSNGTATVTGTGGTTPYTYNWSATPAQTSSIASGLTAGTYTVTILDKHGCVAINSITINQPASGLNTTTSVTATGCTGNSGTADVNVGGGSFPYGYTWSTTPPQNAPMATGLGAATYTVTVSDASGCTITAVTTVNNSSTLAATITPTNVSCNGASTGQAAALVTGGATAYTYLWNSAPSQTGATATNLKAGNYSVTVTDQNGCVFVANTSITQPTAISIKTTAGNVTCNGLSNGTASASVSGGTPSYTYSWSNTSTGTTITGLVAGPYTLTVTDALSCPVTSAVTITQPGVVGGVTSSVAVTCFGGANGVGMVTPAGGTSPYSYAWSSNPVQTTQTVSGLMAGSYTVTITDSYGCTGTAVDVLTATGSQITPAITSSVASCGSVNGSISVAPTGGIAPYMYSWSTGATAATLNAQSAGVFNVTVTDSKGCSASTAAVLNNAGAATVSATGTVVNENCYGLSSGSAIASATGGSGTLSYSWSNGTSGATASGLAAGTYVVTVTDAANCKSISNVTITQPSAILVASTQTGAACFSGNGSAYVTVSGGVPTYVYNWSSGSTTSVSGSVAAAGYTLTVTDANTCSVTTVVTITQPAVLGITFTTTEVSCKGGSNGSLTAMVTGGSPGYTYLWTNSDKSATAGGLVAGGYTVTVTDINSCTNTASGTITEPAALTVNVSATPPSCNGGNDGTVSASGSGGTGQYIYHWSTSPIQTASAVTGLKTGLYFVSVSDVNGCIDVVSDSVKKTAPIVAAASGLTNTTCGSTTGSVNITAGGGTPGYTYSWSNGATTANLSSVGAGAYSLKVTDSKGCTVSTSVIIGNTNGPSVSLTPNYPHCFGASTGALLATPTGGTGAYTYSWSNGGGTGSQIDNIPAGNYTVMVTDANACPAFASFNLIQPTPLVLATSATANLCNGGSAGAASAVASGGAGNYLYSWSNTQNTSVISNLTAGTYTVTVKDENSCPATAAVVVGQSAAITATFTHSSPTCNGSANGKDSISAVGGAEGYSFKWNNSDSTQTVADLTSGTYKVTVTDKNGCTAAFTDIINATGAITIAPVVNNTACGGKTGSATATSSGGLSPYYYTWSTNPVQSNLTATALDSGKYTVTVSDFSGCEQTATVQVGSIAPGSLTLAEKGTSCFGTTNGKASVNLAGGTSPFTYAWNTTPVQTTDTAFNVKAGTYTVTVTDKNNCSLIGTVTVTQPNTLTINKTRVSASCNACSDGSATATPAGGTGPYTYLWTGGATGQTISNKAHGTYQICVTDANGCNTCDTVLIKVNIPLGLSALGQDGSALSLNAWPNPTSGDFTFEISSAVKQDMYIRLVNVMGQVVFSDKAAQVNLYTRLINMEGYANGIYVLQLQTAEGTLSKRIVLQQ